MISTIAAVAILILAVVFVVFFQVNKRRPKFFRGSLKIFERSLFKELENKLENPAAALIPKQLACLTRGVRLYFPKSYTLELYQDKKKPLPENILFSRKDEFTLATLFFTVYETKYKAEVSTYSGRLWGIKVSPNPKKLFWKQITHIDKFKLNNDPMEQLDGVIHEELYTEGHHFESLLGELSMRHTLSRVLKPLPKKQKELFVRLSETKFPRDLLELFDQTNGFIVDGVQVAGFGRMQTIMLDDADYLMIAEKEGGCLTIKKTKERSRFTFHSYEDNDLAEDLGDKFLTALNLFLKP